MSKRKQRATKPERPAPTPAEAEVQTEAVTTTEQPEAAPAPEAAPRAEPQAGATPAVITKEMLDLFRKRLSAVEAKVARLKPAATA